MIKLMLGLCIGALLVFAAYEVAGAQRGPTPEGYVRCESGSLAPLELEVGDFEEGDVYAIEQHWYREADPCGDRWQMPAQMLRDNLWWFEQWIRWATRNDDYDLTVDVYNLTQIMLDDVWRCGDGYISGGCVNVQSCGVGEVMIREGNLAIGTIELVVLIHELTHVIELNMNQCWPTDYAYKSHGEEFYSAYRWALLSLLGQDILPHCVEHGIWCEWGTP